jgi:hypothetical protein
MTKTKATVTTFEAGDPIPGWLLTVDPTASNSFVGDFQFGGRTHIVEFNDMFFLIPEEQTKSPLSLSAGRNLQVAAATKTVVVPCKFFTLEPGAKATDKSGFWPPLDGMD